MRRVVIVIVPLTLVALATPASAAAHPLSARTGLVAGRRDSVPRPPLRTPGDVMVVKSAVHVTRRGGDDARRGTDAVLARVLLPGADGTVSCIVRADTTGPGAVSRCRPAARAPPLVTGEGWSA